MKFDRLFTSTRLTITNTKLSYCWQTARHYCPLANDGNLLARFCDHSPDGSSRQHIGRIFRVLPTPSHMTPSMTGIPSSYGVHIWCGKTRMAGRQSGEGRMMIDSVVWAQYINVTDRQTDRHVAIANSMPIHWCRVAKWQKSQTNQKWVSEQRFNVPLDTV